MASPQSCPAGLQNQSSSRNTNIFTVFTEDNSDSGDEDFDLGNDVASDTDDTDSSSDNTSDTETGSDSTDRQSVTINTTNEWKSVTAPEPHHIFVDPGFTVTNSESPRNISPNMDPTDPISYFRLFLDNDVLTPILRETNSYANVFLGSDEVQAWMRLHPKSVYTQWPEEGITMKDLEIYLGLTINMGIIRKKRVSDYWSTEPSQSTPYFNQMMPYWRYNMINRMLHVVDSTKEMQHGHPSLDPWSKIRPLLDKVNYSCKHYYVPSRFVSIDESMICIKNRLVQYMPQKHHSRFGMKKFHLRDNNGYVYHTELYAGKDFTAMMKDGQAVEVVKLLMDKCSLLNRGYHLFTNSFYTKPALAEYLFENRTLLTGTIRANSEGLPKDFTKQKIEPKVSKFLRKNEQLLVIYREKKSQKKPVALLSTAHTAQMITKTIEQKEHTKPSVMFDYNLHMGGVDLSNKRDCYYAGERGTHSYWKKIFFNLIDISLFNAFVLFILNMKPNKLITEQEFISSIVESLCKTDPATPLPHPLRLAINPAAVLHNDHRIQLLPGKKELDCFVCSDRSRGGTGRKRTRHWCARCEVGCHERCEASLVHEDQLRTKKRLQYLLSSLHQDMNAVDTDMIPPESVKGMTDLKREAFTKTVKKPGIKIPKKELSKTQKVWRSLQLKVRGLKPIGELADKDPDKTTHCLIFLDPSKLQVDQLTVDQKNLLEKFGQDIDNPTTYEVELHYENWTVSDILRSVLPSDADNVSSFTQIGHIAHLNLKPDSLPYKSLIGQVILDKLPTIKTVVNKLNQIDNTYRNFEMELLAGEENFITQLKEHRCVFEMDFSKVYWNSRLSTEHHRIVEQIPQGSIVYDVFAGIGPFAVPLAKQKQCIVFANDLNPYSFKYLERNIELNKIKEGAIQAFNLDGREFIKTVVKNDLSKRIGERNSSMQHTAETESGSAPQNEAENPSLVGGSQAAAIVPSCYVLMNLPALAVDFLDAFNCLLQDLPSDFTKSDVIEACLPQIFCYTFSSREDMEDVLRARVETALSLSLPIGCDVRVVRNVAPNKEMMCVSFKLWPELVLGSRNGEKKPTAGDMQETDNEPESKKQKLS